MTIVPLNLPKAPLNLTRKKDVVHVRCLIRNKDLVCTPEEWVRQHVLHFLLEIEKIGRGRIACEFEFKYNGRSKRADIIVLSSEGKPEKIIECKATHVPLSYETFFQIAQYNHELDVKDLIITNGLQHLSVGLDEHNEPKVSPIWEKW